MSECFWSAMRFAQKVVELPFQAKGVVQMQTISLLTKMSAPWRVQILLLGLDRDCAQETVVSQLSKKIAPWMAALLH